MTDPVRQWYGLLARGHRPWPLPRRPWAQGQSWRDLLFAHYRVDAGKLRPLVPEHLRVETCDGTAWLGITPFLITGFRPEGLPPIPGLSSFPELNVRTYVTDGRRPGIWFFSLDAASRLAVAAARRFYRLPYYRARMTIEREGSGVRFSSERVDEPRPARLEASYEPIGAGSAPPPGSLEAFLVERYCLYARDGGRLLRAEIHHPPWRIRPARGELWHEGLAPVPVADGEPLLHVAGDQHVLAWWPEPA